MLHSGFNTNANESIVPPNLDGYSIQQARRQAAAECFAEHEKLRSIVLSEEEPIRINSNKSKLSKSSTKNTARRKKRKGQRRDFTESDTYEHKGSGITFKINNDTGLGAYTNMLEAGITQLTTCFAKWKRLTAIRVDLHMDNPGLDNKVLTKFCKNLNRKVKRRFPRSKQIGYYWVAEVGSKSKKKHYHLHLYINGHCVRTSHHIMPMIETTWKALTNGYARHDYTKYINSIGRLHTAVYDMSYLAKSRDKNFQPKNANDFSTSRIK